MSGLPALLATTLLCVAPVAAQTVPPLRAGAPAVDLHRYQADQHRLEMERLRAQADQREALARQLELETRLNRQRLEAARRSDIFLPPLPPTPRPSAPGNRPASASNLDQIDAWLDQGRD